MADQPEDSNSLGPEAHEAIKKLLDNYISAVSTHLMSHDMDPKCLESEMDTLETLVSAGRRAHAYATRYRHRYLYTERKDQEK